MIGEFSKRRKNAPLDIMSRIHINRHSIIATILPDPISFHPGYTC